MKRIIFMLSAIIIFNMLFHCDNIFAANKLLSSDLPTKDSSILTAIQCFQQFILNDKGSGIIEIIPQANLNVKLDITNAQSKNGTLVKTYVNNPKYHYAQEFKLVYQNGRIPSYKIVSLISDKEKKVV